MARAAAPPAAAHTPARAPGARIPAEDAGREAAALAAEGGPDREWRRAIAPQDALLWWLTPRIARRVHRSAMAALAWALANLRGPQDLPAWRQESAGVPGIRPQAVARYLSEVPVLLGARAMPASAASVEHALERADLDVAPPGVPRFPSGPGHPPPAHGGGGDEPWSGIRLTPDMIRAAQWAYGSAADKVTEWAAQVRADLRWQIAAGVRAGRTGREQAAVLRDRFPVYGADFLRVALTETHEAMMAGRLANYPDGASVRAILAPGACPDCKRLLDGRTFTVRHEPGDPKAEVWPGKSNAGLKAPQWGPCIPMHPRCRCVWQIVDFGRLLTT